MRKKYGLIIVVILIFLAAAALILARLNIPALKTENAESLSIVRNGELIRVFTLTEIKGFPYTEIEKEIFSSSHDDEKGVWRGVALKTLLGAIDPQLLLDAGQIIARAEDSYVAAYSSREVALGNNVLVVYAQDGKDLLPAAAGGSGPLRIVVSNDPFGTRCVKNLGQIEVK
jgi:DMSO/TMAO reductase YedYZ molybdopterin-dependent catalytic subunit